MPICERVMPIRDHVMPVCEAVMLICECVMPFCKCAMPICERVTSICQRVMLIYGHVWTSNANLCRNLPMCSPNPRNANVGLAQNGTATEKPDDRKTVKSHPET